MAEIDPQAFYSDWKEELPCLQGVGMGYVPQDSAPESNGPQGEPPPPKLVLFTSPAPDKCVLQAMQDDASKKTGGDVIFVTAGAFVGLAGTGGAIGPFAPTRSDVLAVAGTLGAVVQAGSKFYVLGSNHAMSFNGRANAGSCILEAGPLDDFSGGEIAAGVPACVPLDPGLNTPNIVDCAVAEVAASRGQSLDIVPDTEFRNLLGRPVKKHGRSDGNTRNVTRSRLALYSWTGPVDFTFGTYYFRDLAGTFDPVPNPPFAVPGDSGGCVHLANAGSRGLGLLMARAFAFGSQMEVTGAWILFCPFSSVGSELVKKNVLPGPIQFFATVF